MSVDYYSCSECDIIQSDHELSVPVSYTIRSKETDQLCLDCFVAQVNDNNLVPYRINEKTEHLFLVLAQTINTTEGSSRTTKQKTQSGSSDLLYKVFPVTESDIWNFPLKHLPATYVSMHLIYFNEHYNYTDPKDPTFGSKTIKMLLRKRSFSERDFKEIKKWCPYINCQTGRTQVFVEYITKIVYDSPVSTGVEWKWLDSRYQLYWAHRQLMFLIYSPDEQLVECNWDECDADSHFETICQKYHSVFTTTLNYFPKPLLHIIGNYAKIYDLQKIVDERNDIQHKIKLLNSKLTALNHSYDKIMSSVRKKESRQKASILANTWLAKLKN